MIIYIFKWHTSYCFQSWSQYAWVLFNKEHALNTRTAHAPTTTINTHTLAIVGSSWPKNYKLMTGTLTITLQIITQEDFPPPSTPHVNPSYFVSWKFSKHTTVFFCLCSLQLIKRLFKQPIIGSCQQRTAGSQGMPVASQVSCQATGLKLWTKPPLIISRARRMCSRLWRVARKSFRYSRFLFFFSHRVHRVVSCKI